MIVGETYTSSTSTYYGSMRDTGAYALFVKANELAARGVQRVSADVRVTIPGDCEKARLNSIRNHMKRAAACLEEDGFLIEDYQVEGGVSHGLKIPTVTVTMIGSGEAVNTASAHAGQDILQVGWLGLEGMLRIIGEKEAELRERFTPAFIRQMKELGEELRGVRKVKAARELGISFVRQIGEGGILASLWELAVETECGLKLDLKRFAVRQETIEVCEHFRLNPYQLASGGAFLMLAENGEAAAEALQQQGIPAAVIGQLTDNNDKVIHNGEDMRYIDRPAPDELNKIF